MTSQPGPKPKRKNPTWLVVSFVAILTLCCGIGSYVFFSQDPPADSAATPPAASGAVGGAPRTTAPKAPSVDIYDEGVLLVGTDVRPGRYRATVPPDSVNCYWARLKGTSGSLDDVIANGNGEPGERMTVTIARSDKAFETHDCGVWEKI